MGWEPSRTVPDCDRLLVVLSDIEMGAGGPFDDFPHSDFLADLILRYNEPPFNELAVDLVLNGDTFDLLKTSYQGKYPRHITREIAVGKMACVAEAHAEFFAGIRSFLAHTKAPRRVLMLDGNHDAELRFTEVQELIRTQCEFGDQVFFPGYNLEIGRVHIEHGQQHDELFKMDTRQPLIEYGHEEILNLSWGAAALLDAVLPLQPIFHFHDRLKPKELIFKLMPEIRELLVNRFWQYWTRDYWKDFFGTHDPTKKLRWTMLKEVVWRLGSKHVNVAITPHYHKRIEQEGAFDLYILGHVHRPQSVSYGHRKVIQSGCFRNEYMILDEGKRLHPIPKSYIEVYIRDGQPVISQLLEIEGPPPPPNYVPSSIFDILPQVREQLARDLREKSPSETRIEQAAQEAREAQEEQQAASEKTKGES